MKESKGFKETEIGLIPEDWEVVRLGEVFKITQKPKNLKLENYNLIPFIPMENIGFGTFNPKYVMKNPKDISSGTYFEKGDLLLAKITPSFENGKQSIVNDIPIEFGIATTEVIPLKQTEKSLISYLFYYLMKPEFRKYLALKMEGSTGRKRLSKEVLFNSLIPLPPLEEQKAVANILSTVQNAIEKTEKVINATKQLKKSMMKHLFTYGAVAVDEIDKVKLKESEIGLIPENWEVVKLGEVAEITMGQSPPGDTYNTYGKGIPFLQGKAEFGNISPKHIKYTTKPLKIAKKGSVLISVRAPVGDVNIADMDYCIGRGLASLNLKNGINEYLFYSLSFFKHLIEKESYGSVFKAINKENLAKLKIPLPPLDEQQKIANILTTIDQKIQAEEKKKIALQNLFKTLLQQLMTGKIRIRYPS
ncbi:MAG: restriction endonuclease subunit S [Sulfurihydrogenibium sp.]|jgi:type I restriction enzyme S subunit|nr:restriction endonuclease subunit S [Sulfurihydrogenibium sp.]